jgi:energy-coupling factor transport system ATP-binding protein
MVFQYPEHQLFEETVGKDIAFGPKNLGLSEAECNSRVREALSRVGLEYETFAARSPFELSGGQMRRVAVAGVLAMRPSTLILDEPTAGMDPRGRRELLDLLDALHHQGATIVLVSHSMEDVANRARHVFVLSKGALAMEGAPGDIFAQADSLRALGLDVPDIARLRDQLRSRGIDLPEDAYTHEPMRRALAALWNKRGRIGENGGAAT